MTAFAPRALRHPRGPGTSLDSRAKPAGLVRGLTPIDAAVWTAGVGFGVLLGLLDAYARLWAAPLMVLAVLGLGALYVRLMGWRVGVLLVLLVTGFTDRYLFRVGPLDLRAEEVAMIGAIAVLAVTRLREPVSAWLRPNLAEGLLIAWFGLSVISSLVASPDRRLSAKIIVLVAVCSLGFFLPRRILQDRGAREDLDTLIRWLLIVFATEAAWGSAAYLLHAFGPTISITPNPASGHLSAYGTLWEQNVFGAVCAAGAVAWIYLGPSRFRNAWIGVAICTSGLVDSLTRAAWLAAGIAALVGISLSGLRRRIDMTAAGVGLLGGLIAAAAVLVTDRIGVYTVPVPGANTHPKNQGLLGAIFNMTDFIGRLNQLSPIWSDIHGIHVLFGRGTASFEALHVDNGVAEHIASLPLLILNDTGVAGLFVFGAFITAVVAAVLSRRHDPVTVGLGQVALVMFIGSLATQTTELMIGWLLAGILMAAIQLAPAVAETRTKATLREDAA